MSRKIFTREDWDGYKSRHITTQEDLERNFSGLIGHLCDPYSWGMDTGTEGGCKRQKYKTDTLNRYLMARKWMLVDNTTGEMELKPAHLLLQMKPANRRAHITSDKIKLFYTSSPWSNISIAGIDLDDNETTTQADMDGAVQEIRDIFGYEVYAEPSTRGKGRHIYPIIDFTDYANRWWQYPRVPREGDDRKSFSEACNRILFSDSCSLHKLLKQYFAGRYNLKFDGLKGLYTSYHSVEKNGYYLKHPRPEGKEDEWLEDEWVETKESQKYLQRTYGSLLLKMPKLITPSRYYEFTSSPVLPLPDLVAIIRKLLILLGYMDSEGIIVPRDIIPDNPIYRSQIFTLRYFGYPGSQISQHDAEQGRGEPDELAQPDFPSGTGNADCLQPDKAHPDLSSSMTNAGCLIPPTAEAEELGKKNTTPLHTTSAVIGGTFSTCEDLLGAIRGEKDALWRSQRYLGYCYCKYITEKNREPSKEEFRKDYRTDVGTDVEDEGDVERLNNTYDRFLPEVRSFYNRGIKGQIEKTENNIFMSKKEIRKLRDDVCRDWETGTKKAGVTSRDLAIAATWLSSCLLSPRNSRHVKFSGGRHSSRELTAPMAGLISYFAAMKKCGMSKTGCDGKKAKILREMLVAMEWIKIVDSSKIIGGKDDGRAWRYILLPAHPLYKRFAEHVGGGKIQWWKSKAEREQLDQGGQIA